MLGFATASVRDAIDDRFKSPADLESAGLSPVFAVIPEERNWVSLKGRSIAEIQPHLRSIEAFRNLRTSFRLIAEEQDVKTVMITSAEPNEGSRSWPANLAMSLAAAGVLVLLVDADLRSPSIGELFQVRQEHGLAELLLGTHRIEDVTAWVPGYSSLALITSDVPVDGASELVAGRWDRDFTRSLAEHAEIVVIDAPPVLPVAETQQMGATVDGLLFVVRSKRAARESVNQAIQQLRRANSTVLGYVLTRDRQSSTSGYGDVYGYARPIGRTGRTNLGGRRVAARTGSTAEQRAHG